MEVKKAGKRRNCKKMKKVFGRCLTCALILACSAVFLCLSIFGAEGDYQSQNKAYATEKYGRLDDLCSQHYFEKVEGDPYLAESQTCSVVYGYVNDIKALLLSAEASTCSLESEIDLLYEKGVAAGILSWIYYSNHDVKDAQNVRQVYASRLEAIKSATDVYFFKSGEVEGCYTLLFQSVYSEKIKALSLDGDSDTVSAMIAAAPASMGALCRYDTSKGGEDGDGYREFYENTVKSVKAQRSRDEAQAQVEYAFLEIFKGENQRMPSALADFYNSLNTKTGRAEMNLLAAETVRGLLLEVKADKGEYALTLLDKTRDSVTAEAERASEKNTSVDFKTLFGDFSLLMLRADCKDALLEQGKKTAEEKNCSEELGGVLLSGLCEYLKDGGLFDLADEKEVPEVLKRGQTECGWFSFFADRLYEIQDFLGAENGLSVEAKEKYLSVAEEIRKGSKTGEGLEADKNELQGLVTQAEALRFESDHRGILNDADITLDDLAAVESAISAAKELTPAAAALLEVRLSYLSECCRKASVDALLSTVREDGLREKRAAAAEALAKVLRELPAEKNEGILDLDGFLATAKEYIKRGELLRALFDAYAGEYGDKTGKYFGKEAGDALTTGKDSISVGTYDESTLGKYELLFAKLSALEGIYSEAEGYFDSAEVTDILTGAEAEIRAITAKGGIEPLVLQKTAEIKSAVRNIEVGLAKAEIGTRGEEISEKIENYIYVSAETKDVLMKKLTLAITAANEKIEGAASAEAVFEALSSALDSISAVESECENAEFNACNSNAKETLNTCFGEKDNYSEENYARILEIIGKYQGLLEDKTTTEEIKVLLDEGVAEIGKIEDKLREAKRIYLAVLLLTRDTLLSTRERYSPENAALIEDIYFRTVSEIEGIKEIPKYTEISPLCEAREKLMREVPVNKVYTSDGAYINGNATYPSGYDADSQGYFGAVLAEGGLPSNAHLTIKNISAEGIESLIKKAARKKTVYLLGGEKAERELLKYLKNCRILAAVDIDLGVTPLSDGVYKVTMLIPDGIDTSDALGAVFISEDGRVEFYPLTVAAGTAEFETGHFSKYYLVKKGEADLTPVIICLSIAVVCELALVAALLYRRRRRKKEDTLFLFAPFLLAQRYRPAGALVTVGILSAAAVVLGGIIVYLLTLEIKDARQRKKRPVSRNELTEKTEENNADKIPVLAEARMPQLSEEYAQEIYVGEETEGNDEETALDEQIADVEETEVLLQSAQEEQDEEIAPTVILPSVSAEEAETLMSDAEAVRFREEIRESSGERHTGRRAEVNLDAVSAVFEDGDTVNIHTLKEKGLVTSKAKRVKVLGRGILDKRLTIIADDFSAAAEKMILLVGGTVVYRK